MKNLKQKIYKNQKLVIYGIIAFCIISADYVLFFKSLIADLKKTLPQAAQVHSRLTNANNAVVNIPRYEAQIKELRSRLSSYNKRFSTQQQISSLLQELSDIAKNSGVKITSVKPHSAVTQAQQGTATAVYKKFPISITATCGYHQLGIFLNNLENADTFMRIADISITADTNKSSERAVYIVVNTYILTDEKA